MVDHAKEEWLLKLLFQKYPKIVLHVGDGGNQNGSEMRSSAKFFNAGFPPKCKPPSTTAIAYPLGIFIGL